MENIKKIVSIIIPVFNSEKYLPNLLNSVLFQDYNNLEIILVNDGSTDNSLEIMKEYMQSDNRIKIINQRNLGVAAARNNGFYNSVGDYIYFVDSDDIIEKDLICNLVNCIEKYECDVSCCNVHIYEKDGSERYTVNDKSIKMYNSYELINMFLLGEISHACWDKLYKRKILDEVNFPLKTTGEDRYFCWNLYRNIDKMVVSPKVGYNYIRKKSNSITSMPLSIKNVSRIEEALKLKVDIILHYPELYEKWEYYYYVGLDNLYKKFMNIQIKENDELYKYFEFISKELCSVSNKDNKYINQKNN